MNKRVHVLNKDFIFVSHFDNVVVMKCCKTLNKWIYLIHLNIWITDDK